MSITELIDLLNRKLAPSSDVDLVSRDKYTLVLHKLLEIKDFNFIKVYDKLTFCTVAEGYPYCQAVLFDKDAEYQNYLQFAIETFERFAFVNSHPLDLSDYACFYIYLTENGIGTKEIETGDWDEAKQFLSEL